MAIVNVGTRYQITIPRGIRSALGDNYGGELDLTQDGDRVLGRFIAAGDNVIGYRVQVRDRNQISLPKELCRSLKFQDSQVLELTVEDGFLIITLTTLTHTSIMREPFVPNPKPNEFQAKKGLQELSEGKRRK